MREEFQAEGVTQQTSKAPFRGPRRWHARRDYREGLRRRCKNFSNLSEMIIVSR
jgi:hypothetical protein